MSASSPQHAYLPQRVFLGWQAPALELVTDRLLQLHRETPSLFRRALIIVPTEESGRRLRERLAEKAEGQALLVPRICLSGALTTAPDEASPLETMAAWLAVLSEASPSQRWPRLFPVPPRRLSREAAENEREGTSTEKDAEGSPGEAANENSEGRREEGEEGGEQEEASIAWALPTARQFIALRRQLEQAGLTPAHVVRHLRAAPAGTPHVPDEEEARWQEMEELFAAVDERLRRQGYHPAEEARRRKQQHALWPGRTPLIILACLPHVSLQTRRFLAALPREQGRVEIWIHAPQSHADHVDDWGQPGEYWSRCPLPVSDASLHVLPDAYALAKQAVQLLEGVPSEQAVLGVCDPDMLPALHAAFHTQGWPLYLPEGRHPLTSDLLRLATEWIAAASSSARAADLGQLLRNTAFQQLCGLTPPQQQAFDELLDTVEQNYLPDRAEALLLYLQKAAQGELGRSSTAATAAKHILSACRHLLPSSSQPGTDAVSDGLNHLLEALSALCAEADTGMSAALPCVQELLRLRHSRLAPTSRAAFCALVCHHFAAFRLPSSPRSTTVLDALGWMELIYASGQRVVLTGLHEGCVPEAPATDAYLPDSLRHRLGMDCHARRVERDSFLLCALLASHPEQVDLLVARNRDDGSILSPSGLLTRCPDDPPEALPRRVQQLFTPLEVRHRSLPFERGGWLIGAPDAGLRHLPRPPERHLPSDGLEPISLITGSLPHPWSDPARPLSPSALNNFLACPLRFWLSRVLRLDPGGALVEDKSSLQARDYGSILHDILRDFAADFPRWTPGLTPAQLTSRAEELLQAQLRRLFGTRPPVAVLAQQELMQNRLRRFARLHGQHLQEGWEVLSLEEEQSWTWRNIPLTIRPDRVDRHRDGSLRLLDYKTNDILPRNAHLKRLTPEAAALYEAFLPSFPLLKDEKRAYRVVNVQLPLYAAWVEERYGCLPAMLYVNLPRKQAPVAFNSFDITPEERDILLTHAEEAARLIRGGLCLYSAESLGDEAFTTFGQLAPDGDLRAMVGLPPLVLPSPAPSLPTAAS